MAKFSGTIQEFDSYIGPRLRNIVQTSLARKYRNEIGKCEMCGKSKDLQAAHVHGFDRKTLIKSALSNYFIDDHIVDADIAIIEERFKELHKYPEKIFKILCRHCHQKYDNVGEIITIEDVEMNDKLSSSKYNNRDILPIEFVPEDVDEFKEQLLLHKRALIIINYNSGVEEAKEWNASNIKESSDIIGNLRSRKEFRSGNWQDSNIKSIRVEINEIDI